jgi:hypothetical protein
MLCGWIPTAWNYTGAHETKELSSNNRRLHEVVAGLSQPFDYFQSVNPQRASRGIRVHPAALRMSNATLCATEDECPDAQLCQEGQCKCFWRYGLTGDACDQWTARAVWRITGRALCLAIYLAAGMHAHMLAWRVL